MRVEDETQLIATISNRHHTVSVCVSFAKEPYLGSIEPYLHGAIFESDLAVYLGYFLQKPHANPTPPILFSDMSRAICVRAGRGLGCVRGSMILGVVVDSWPVGMIFIDI